MGLATVKGEMYCPKCKQSFEEGSRRFCPTDGARLLSDTPNSSGGQWEGGIFANLITKSEVRRERDESIPQFVINNPEPAQLSLELEDISGDFFELEDIEPDIIVDPIIVMPSAPEPAEDKVARKIDPAEIPAGHAELGGGDPLGVSSADFSEDDPEGFVGRTVKGRYLVTEFLGGEDGTFAFLADDKIVEDKMVSVRILLDDGTDEALRSILDEERVSLSHISHPNIARIIDSGQFTDATRFLISEYVDALSASDILQIHGNFSDVRAARIIRQIASALNEVHQEGILHRDLRPENIIVAPGESDTEQATLVNFGASSGEPNDQNIAYKAPEVLDGRISTTASDIFSLAVVAYEMLTGNRPFRGTTAKQVTRSQYAGMDPLPSKIRPELPTAVESVLEKALSFKIAGRYLKARDFGDAFYAALTESRVVDVPVSEIEPETILSDEPQLESAAEHETAAGAEPVVPEIAVPAEDEPAWKNRSPEPPQVANSRSNVIAGSGLLALLALLAFGWYYVVKHPAEPEISQITGQTNVGSPALPETEMPPQPRNIPQPPNTNYYQNNKQNLKGDLLRHFVGFTMYYPKDWKINGPQESVVANTRGKFLDISRSTPEGRLKEQMLVSYYPSKGTFKDDAGKFPQMVKETNETLKKLLPGYQVVSQGEIKVNGDWRAYEVKFQGGGTSAAGEKLIVWGRRLFIPAARPGVRNGFEITMLATSSADAVRNVDDVGVRGELAAILDSFEPSQNF